MNNHPRNVTQRQSLGLATLIGLAPSASAEAQEPVRDVEGERFFVEKIEPLLESYCFECHSHAADEMEGGLMLDSRLGGLTDGGSRGPAVVPGKPEESLLITAVRRKDANLKMPPDEKLTDANIELLVEWIKRGAPDPRTTELVSPDGREPTAWWSLRPLQRPAVPQLARQDGEAGNPIDAFVRQRLQIEGLAPVPRADRRTLIRRLYFDLHGLPPTPEAVAAFVCDLDPTLMKSWWIGCWVLRAMVSVGGIGSTPFTLRIRTVANMTSFVRMRGAIATMSLPVSITTPRGPALFASS